MVATMDLVTIKDISLTHDEPRISDHALARGLGYRSVHEVRKLFNRNRSELETYGEIIIQEEVSSQIDGKPYGGRPKQEYLFTEQQALTLCCFARTSQAALMRGEMVKAFIDAKNSPQGIKAALLVPIKTYIPKENVTKPEFFMMNKFGYCFQKRMVFQILAVNFSSASEVRAYLAGKYPAGSELPTNLQIIQLRRMFNGHNGAIICAPEDYQLALQKLLELVDTPMKYNNSSIINPH